MTRFIPWWPSNFALSNLTKTEKEVLVNVIDCYVEGLIESKEIVIEDRSIVDPEELLNLVANFDEETTILHKIRKELTR